MQKSVQNYSCPLSKTCAKPEVYLGSTSRPTPTGPVKWRYWPRRTRPALQFSIQRDSRNQDLNMMELVSKARNRFRTRQILLKFYPSVQMNSQFMSHDWELVVCPFSAIVIRQDHRCQTARFVTMYLRAKPKIRSAPTTNDGQWLIGRAHPASTSNTNISCAEKCQVLSSRTGCFPGLHIGGKLVAKSSSVKDLGVWLDEGMNMQTS
jgi:hypothetical protein